MGRHPLEAQALGLGSRHFKDLQGRFIITGVPVVDTQVAHALLQTAQAVQLLGAQMVLTGIRPEVAQTLVRLGVELRGIITRGTLQDGIAYAIRRV